MLDGLVVEPEEGVQRTALLQLSHGMSEYKERYLPFMEFMAEHGIVCVIQMCIRDRYKAFPQAVRCL